MFMNEYDIERARARFIRACTPNRLSLAIMVDRLAEWTDQHSDGWAYWRKPQQAAQQAIGHIESRTRRENDEQESHDISEDVMLAAARPVKAFCTRQVNAGHMTADQRELILRSTRPMFEVI